MNRRLSVFKILLPVFALFIPSLIVILTSGITLTSHLSSELVFADYLHQMGSHTFAKGWLSSKQYFPLSPRFFLTFNNDILSDYKASIKTAVLLSNCLFSLSYLAFTFSLRAKKMITYIVLSVFGACISVFLSLNALKGGLLITYASFIFLSLAFLILGIRLSVKSFKKPVLICLKVCIIALSVLPFLLSFIHISLLSQTYEINTVFSGRKIISPAATQKEQGDDLLEKYGDLSNILESNDIKKAYSTVSISNEIKVLTHGKTDVSVVDTATLLNPVAFPDMRMFTKDEFSFEDESVYLICNNGTLSNFKDSYLHTCSDVLYSDSNISLLKFDDKDYLTDNDLLTDLTAISSKSYGIYFASMFDVTCLSEDDIELYIGRTPYIFQKTFSDKKSFDHADKYLSYIFSESDPGSDPSEVFLGIDPCMISDISLKEERQKSSTDFADKVINKLADTINSHKNTYFRIIFPYYLMDHYLNMSKDQIASIPASYEKIASALSKSQNVCFYFMGNTEWIRRDPYLFTEGSDIVVKPENTQIILANILAGYHQVTASNIASEAEKLRDSILSYNPEEDTLPSLSDCYICALGDSIMADRTDATSITKIISNYSNTDVLCLAQGGAAAAKIPWIDVNQILQGQIDTIISDKDKIEKAAQNKALIFLLEFGINDYFRGVLADNEEDPYDEFCYGGAMRSAISAISSNYPDASIIVLSPGYVNINEYGEMSYSDGAPVLSEYRKTSAKLAEELGVYLFDLRKDPGFTQESFERFSYGDGVHYNEDGRLIIGKTLIRFIASLKP